MRRKVRLTADALADLADIEDYIRLDSPRRAKSFVRELREACLSLGEMPERFPVVIASQIGAYRRRPFGSFLIFYAIEEQGVFIVRVVNAARDADQLFAD